MTTQATTSVFDSIDSADGLFAVDSQQRIVRWNAAAERILGRPLGEVMGRYCYDVVAGREDMVRRHCRKNCPVVTNALRGRQVRDYDLLCTTPDGESKWLNFSIVVPVGGAGRGFVLHLFRDVTGRRRVEEFARSAASALKDLQSADGQLNKTAGQAPAPVLSRREEQVLRLIAVGMRTKQIAEALGVKPITARNHVTRLLNKLGASSRLQAVVYASQRGIV
jgi:PAS domain S-box-containing protein